jgi:iron-sulfur cluster assembly protein
MLQLSPVAISEIQRIQSRQSQPNAFVRLGITPGGCADYYYTLKLEETGGAIAPEEQIFMCGDIKVVVDPHSYQLLEGLTLDYSEDLMGGGFRFHNPQAIHTCGCGNSFSLQPSTAPSEDCPNFAI